MKDVKPAKTVIQVPVPATGPIKIVGWAPMPPRKPVALRLDEATIDRLDRLAESTPELSRSSHIRIALTEYLDRQEQK